MRLLAQPAICLDIRPMKYGKGRVLEIVDTRARSQAARLVATVTYGGGHRNDPNWKAATLSRALCRVLMARELDTVTEVDTLVSECRACIDAMARHVEVLA